MLGPQLIHVYKKDRANRLPLVRRLTTTWTTFKVLPGKFYANVCHLSQCLSHTFRDILIYFVLNYSLYYLYRQYVVTHWSLNKIGWLLQMTLSNAFCWLKKIIVCFKFHWRLLWAVKLARNQHWLRQWLTPNRRHAISRSKVGQDVWRHISLLIHQIKSYLWMRYV